MNIRDRLLAQASTVRVRTGTDAIDRACRGGIPLGKRVVLGGAPGAGKTTLATQWARTLAEAGCKVMVLATDESADAIAIRLGQHVGGDRDRLERGDLSTRQGEVSIPPTLALSEDLTIEQAIRDLGREGPRVLVVDSLQTARSEACKSTAKRTRIEANVAALKRAARSGALVIATSELSRAGYQSAKRAPDMGHLKGSGDIEYDVDLGIALVTRDRGLTVEAHVVKSRLGSKPTFTLYAHPKTAKLLEYEPGAEPPEPAVYVPRLWVRVADWILGPVEGASLADALPTDWGKKVLAGRRE